MTTTAPAQAQSTGGFWLPSLTVASPARRGWAYWLPHIVQTVAQPLPRPEAPDPSRWQIGTPEDVNMLPRFVGRAQS